MDVRPDPKPVTEGGIGRKRVLVTRESLMHLDGCHFFVWVVRDPDGSIVLIYHERDGQGLRAHGRWGDKDGVCEDCVALRNGRKPYSHSKTLDAFPDDAQGAFVAVLTAIAEIEETRAGAGSRPASPVAPDGPERDANEGADR